MEGQPIQSIIEPSSSNNSTIWIIELSTSMLHIVMPMSFIYIAICLPKLTLSISQIISPASFICRPIAPNADPSPFSPPLPIPWHLVLPTLLPRLSIRSHHVFTLDLLLTRFRWLIILECWFLKVSLLTCISLVMIFISLNIVRLSVRQRRIMLNV